MSVIDKFSMRDRVSIVTGGNSGIGYAIAQGLAEAGSAVAIIGRDEQSNTAAVAALSELGTPIIGIRADVSSRDDLQAMLERVTDELGPVDTLVNNAGIGFHANALELGDDEWDRLFSINLEGVWKASQIVGRQMVERGSGSIINIGSMSGLIVNRPQWHSPYGISKAAVHHLTRSLAAEWAHASVRVNAIAPGYVRTGIASTEYEEYRHYWKDEVPMQRYASPDEIAPLAVLLASEAGSFMTGSVLVADGGYTLY